MRVIKFQKLKRVNHNLSRLEFNGFPLPCERIRAFAVDLQSRKSRRDLHDWAGESWQSLFDLISRNFWSVLKLNQISFGVFGVGCNSQPKITNVLFGLRLNKASQSRRRSNANDQYSGCQWVQSSSMSDFANVQSLDGIDDGAR